MAATIQIHEMSALTTGTDKTSGTVRFKNADNATVDTNDPLVVPTAGTIYSFAKKVRAYMEDPPNTNVSNLRWYSDGATPASWSGVGVQYKNLGVTWAANATPTISGTDLFTKTSGDPIDGDATDAGPFVPADDNTYIGDLIALQMSVNSTASNGALPAETLTLAYDEI